MNSIRIYEELPDYLAEVFITQTTFDNQVWQFYFDGAFRASPKENPVSRMGVVLVSTQNYVISHVFSLSEPMQQQCGRVQRLAHFHEDNT